MNNKTIQIGQRVHCILYGGKDGTVVKIHGEQEPGTCRSIHGIGVTGGNAEVDIIWDNGTESRRVPESLLHSSVQWKIYDEVVDEDAVAKSITNGAIAYASALSKAKIEADEFAIKAEECRIHNQHLKSSSDVECEFDRAKTNMRIELKIAWSTIKFSVRSENYGSVRIAWKDGPTCKQVEDLLNKYRSGYFDGQDDIYLNKNTPWNTVFGGAKYISVNRELSTELVNNCLDKLYQALPMNLRNVPKPGIEVLNGYGLAPKIPLINMNVWEGIRAIADVYDCTTGKISHIGNYRYYWLIEMLQQHLSGENMTQ